jgi:hypothetical protein
VRLASAGATNQDDVVRSFGEIALVELAHHGLVDFGGGEIEVFRLLD